MSQPISLTLRLTLLFCAVATIAYLAFAWLLERSLEKHFESGDIKELRLIVDAIEPLLIPLQADHNLVQVRQRFDDILIGHHDPLLRITDVSGNVLYNSSSLDLSLFPIPALLAKDGEVQLWQHDNHSYRVFMLMIYSKDNIPYTVITAVGTDIHRDFIDDFRITLWFIVCLAIVIMAFMSWLSVRHGHRPLHRIVKQISHISSAELNTRLDPKQVPAELTELANSFNGLLKRLDKAFDQLSHFSSDIAHELRTPVTNLMTQTQVALSRDRSVQEYQEILYSNMEEFERLSKTIADMLFLAKTDNCQNPLEIEGIDLHDEISSLFDYYEAWAEDHSVSLSVEGTAHTFGNRLMLRRALSNLLSNAIRHTPKEMGVTISIKTADNNIYIVVKNPGEPIPQQHLAKLFDRFYRIDPSRHWTSDGTGLGLAITQSIVEAHNGSISVRSDETATQFQIILPLITQITLPLKT